MASKDPVIQTDRLSATLALDEPVSHVRLVSPSRAKALGKLGIFTVRDLVSHYPRRYIDLSNCCTVAAAVIGQPCTIDGQVHAVRLKRPRPNLPLVEIDVVDPSGILMVTCFRQPWLADQLKPGMRVAVAGKLEFSYGFKRMTNPFIEVVDAATQVHGRVIPVHPACEKVSTAWMRRLVGNAVAYCEGAIDPLPVDLRIKYRLMSRTAAWRAIHMPTSLAEAKAARRRLAFEELLLLQLHLLADSRAANEGVVPVAHAVDGPRRAALEAALPFSLTDEQLQARDEILAVMAKPARANHMLLGDVGTGKTVIAAIAAAAAADTGGQVLFMVPTEVLATQHASSLGPLFEAAGMSSALLTSATPAAERADIIERLAAGSLDVLIGTHALIEPDVAPANLTLVIIDEQQRFGVAQRQALLEKGSAPDALYLTATPIPRTLALTLFATMTLSYIRHRPHAGAGRTTTVLDRAHRATAYDAALAALARGEQAYVVCPLVGAPAEERHARSGNRNAGFEEDEEAAYPDVSIEGEGDWDDNLVAAEKEAEMLQNTTFIDYSVGLLHGKMHTSEKAQVMERFRNNEIQVLVATTVIEVGVDVPNATVMIVEDADRFGLSQLHQLRGRVGRGTLDAQVFLVSASKQPAALSRLQAMETTDDGYELATFDLSLRREGDIVGNRQSGASSLKLVNIVRDGAMIEAAHAEAVALLDNDPGLASIDHALLAREVRTVFGGARAPQGG